MSLRFPAVRIGSQAEFEAWAAADRQIFDQRWLYEQQQIKSGQSAVRDGTCALCLTPTRFSSPAPADARNWREEMTCGCAHALSNRQRALLHFLRARTGIACGEQVALIGSESPMEGKLAAWGLEARWLPRLAAGKLELADAAADHAICADYLQYVPPVIALLREIARALRPGGHLLLTVPFDVGSAETKSRVVDMPRLALDSAAPLHLFGWNLLDLLRDLSFADVAAHFYWSDEFGYLGPFNMIIAAQRPAG